MFGYNLSKKEKRLALIAIFLGGAAIIYDFVIEPFLGQWQDLSKQIKTKSILLAQNQKLLNAYDRLEKEYTKYQKYIEAAKSEQSLTQTLKEIERMSLRSSCRIINIKPFATQAKGSYKEALFDITAEGSINDFSRFLYELESLKSPLRVSSFSLAPKSHRPGELRGALRVKKIIFLDYSSD